MNKKTTIIDHFISLLLTIIVVVAILIVPVSLYTFFKQRNIDLKKEAFFHKNKSLFCKSNDNVYYINSDKWKYFVLDNKKYFRKGDLFLLINNCEIHDK